MKIYALECYSKKTFPIVGWIIQLFQGLINFHHYALLVQTDDGKLYTYDASTRTLHREAVHNFLAKYKIRATYELGEIDQSKFFKWIFPLEGTVYGHSQILGLLLMVLNIYKTNPFPNGLHKLVCNELILATLCTQNILCTLNIEDYDLIKTHKLLKSYFKEVDINEILSSYYI